MDLLTGGGVLVEAWGGTTGAVAPRGSEILHSLFSAWLFHLGKEASL